MTKVLNSLVFAALVLMQGCYVSVGEDEQTPTVNSDLEPPIQNDAGSGGDVSDSIASPHELDFGTVTGVLDSSDSGDAFGFKMTPGDVIAVAVTPSTEQLDVAIGYYYYATKDDGVIDDRLYGYAEFVTLSSEFSDNEKAFAILVSGKGFGTYTLSVSRRAQNDGGLGGDASDDYENLIDIVPGTYSDGWLGGADFWDKFVVSLSPGKTLTFEVKPADQLDVTVDKGKCYSSFTTCDFAGYGEGVNEAFAGGTETLTYTNSFSETKHVQFGVGYMGKTRGYYTMTVRID